MRFDLCTNSGFPSFDLVVYRIERILQVQFPPLTGLHRNMPSSRARLLKFCDVLGSANLRFFIVQQRKACIDVGLIGRRADDRVDAACSVHVYMRLDAEVPTSCLSGSTASPGRVCPSRSRSNWGLRSNVASTAEPALSINPFSFNISLTAAPICAAMPCALSRCQNCQIVVSSGTCFVPPSRPCEFAMPRDIIEDFFHRWIRQTEPLSEVNLQHRRHRN